MTVPKSSIPGQWYQFRDKVVTFVRNIVLCCITLTNCYKPTKLCFCRRLESQIVPSRRFLSRRVLFRRVVPRPVRPRLTEIAVTQKVLTGFTSDLKQLFKITATIVQHHCYNCSTSGSE